jgi:hypothetical protein
MICDASRRAVRARGDVDAARGMVKSWHARGTQ